MHVLLLAFLDSHHHHPPQLYSSLSSSPHFPFFSFNKQRLIHHQRAPKSVIINIFLLLIITSPSSYLRSLSLTTHIFPSFYRSSLSLPLLFSSPSRQHFHQQHRRPCYATVSVSPSHHFFLSCHRCYLSSISSKEESP